jgi:hypothetical protein
MQFLKKYLSFCVLLLLPELSLAQGGTIPIGIWNITSISGELKAGGRYGFGTTNSYGIDNTTKSYNAFGGVLLKTSSYVWNPSFLKVDIDGGYTPESRQDVYLVFQNHNDMINMRKLHVGGIFFSQKPVSLSTYLNLSDLYDSRENLTDIKTNSKNYGAALSFTNRMLPMSFSYNDTKWDSREINTNRTFSYHQKNFEGRASKSFTVKDKSDLIYTHHDYTREEFDIPTPIRNIADNIQLLNSYFFDSLKTSHFNSNILATNQVGVDSFKQFRATETFYTKLPHNLYLNSSYGYNYVSRPIENLGLHNFATVLSHQLYRSLHTSLIYEYNNAKDSYHEVNNKGGIALDYTKIIPWNGMLTMSYTYSRMHETRTSQDEYLHIMNEEYSISDTRRTMLKRPYIDSSTIIVKDATGTVIYQNGFDYKLNSVGNFIEIQRVPGGQIQENSNVYVFYTANQPGKYSYDVNVNNFMVNVSLFKRLIGVYFKSNRTGYENINMADYLLLDYLNDNIYGTRLEYKMVTAGAEYDDYQSRYVPYKMTRYYLTLQGNYHQRLLLTMNANMRQYKIPSEETPRIYRDVTGMASYAVSRSTKLDLNVGYQNQEGKQINLDLVTARCRLSTYYRKITFSGGIDYYNRIYLDNQKSSYIGANVQIIKKFKR